MFASYLNVENVFFIHYLFLMVKNNKQSAAIFFRELYERSGLSQETLAKRMGYRAASSIQRYLNPDEYLEPYFTPKILSKIYKALLGEGNPPITEPEIYRLGGDQLPVFPAVYSSKFKPPKNDNTIQEIDIRAGMGASGLLYNGDDGDNVIGSWSLPEAYIRHEIHTSPNQTAIIRVQGDSMVPTLLPEDRVMVDRGQVVPISDNIYAVWDGDGVVVKRIRRTDYSGEKSWLLVSDNPQVADRTMPPEAQIVGRVVWRASKL